MLGKMYPTSLPYRLLLAAAVLIPADLAGPAGGSAQAAGSAPAIRVYSHLLEPKEHPDYGRRHVQPPSWDTFGGRTHFTCLRGFNVDKDQIAGYAEELEKMTRTLELGDVIWPSYPILFATNLAGLADEIKRRNLFLFDVWGYVPGSGPGGYWQQFQPPPSAFSTLEAALGERWLGTDIGEQDGRYIGGYADQMHPASASRLEQYLNFQRHFERMGDDLGHKHATLVSLNFGHYFLKEGTYTLIGAETAQALPNNQVYYAFIRGAGKQYGVPWFGNASIFNRWGFKTYGSAGKSDGYEHGPTKGTSLSLLKRLLYTHILYNCMVVGFENGWLEGDRLSPIGRIQQAALRWVGENGQPGVMHTPVALLFDFFAGWTFPRHLYTDKLYRVWGNLPYEPGDYLGDGALDLLYPGYRDSSYFHDESGFITPTPFGDIADCLLSDAPDWLLARYPVVVAAGELSDRQGTGEKLLRYAAQGGRLVISAGNMARLFPDQGFGPPVESKNARRVTIGGEKIDELPMAVCAVPKGDDTTVLATCDAGPVALERRHGHGRITILCTPFGITSEPANAKITGAVDKPLLTPYPLLGHARRVLEDIFRQQRLFEVDPRLSLVTCRKGPGEYTLGIANNSWDERPLHIRSKCGPILSLRELPLDVSEQGAPGQLPEGVSAQGLGRNGPDRIAGGDIRIFRVQVREQGVQEIAHVAPPARPRGLALPLPRARSIKEEVLSRPGFFEQFDGVSVDWRYVREREKAALEAEAGWVRRQGLRVHVDLSSGVNLYPGLRLIDNLGADYTNSMAAVTDVLAKMPILGARDLVFSLHRHPENNFSGEQTQQAFERTLRLLAVEARGRGVTLHLRLAPRKPPWSLEEALKLLERVGAPNLRVAPSVALLDGDPSRLADAVTRAKGKADIWLVGAPRRDITGRVWDTHAPLAEGGGFELARRWFALAPALPVLLDVNYTSPEEESRDAVLAQRLRALAPSGGDARDHPSLDRGH